MKQFKWQKFRPTRGQNFPTSREGLSLTYIPHPYHMLITFGGISNGRLNDLMIYDINNQIWKIQETKGRQPAPRCYHQAFYDEKSECLFIHGGQGDKGRSLSDFCILNLQNFVWKRLFLLEVPQNRHHHTINDMGNFEREQIIFGGSCGPDNILFNDVWIFNYQAITFQSVLPEIPGGQCTLRQTKGDVPSGREGHCSVVLGKYMYILGGRTENPQENTSQLYQLSLETFIWKKIQTMGKQPSPRAFFSGSLFGQDRFVIFGGFENSKNIALSDTYILNLNDLYWNSPFIAGSLPSPRYLHAGTIIDVKNELPQFVILGGLEQTFCSMEFFFFTEQSTSLNVQWEKIREPSNLEEKNIQIAGSIIFNGEKYLQEIEEAIIKERKRVFDVKKELDQVIQEANNLANYTTKRENEIKIKYQQSNLTCKNTQSTIEMIFLMIKQEQMITKEIQQRSELIEEVLQKIQIYMVLLDQFYSALRRNKLDENDPRENKLKKLCDGFAEEYNKAKDGHKETLLTLKNIYEKSNQLLSKVEVDLQQKRRNICEINKDYEQLIFDTEPEEIK